MAIFQSSVLKKYLKQLDTETVAKLYKKYTKYFHDPAIQHNIRESKEEQYQAKFLDELFVNVLGYTMNPQPNFNLTTEFKNIKNSRKADGAILDKDEAIAVIELKGTKTKDLESIRQQAFDYKANQPGCVYVITSNFEKLRFYINNAVDFEEFDLFMLSYERFEMLYLCLHKNNLLQHLPLKIKEASLHEEEAITKKFYSDYSNFKRELFRDMVKRNLRNPALMELGESSSKKELFKKTQKLLDRFLFIFFGEDRGLLPPNSIPKILEQWEALKKMDAYSPLYERYKKYFGYLNEGWKGQDHEIFAYNGGLFKPDPILDTIEIDDELLFKHTSILTKYDFESQVDVNILGHIFEHSLNEIESVNAEIDGVEFDKQKTKRKKDGVFYTPKYITKYIVDNTVGKLCEEKKAELDIHEEEYLKGPKNRAKTTIQKLDEQLEAYRAWLLTLTICDPACGSGAFLNQALDFLILEHRWIDEMSSKLHGGGFVFPDIENSILEKNIYGVDLNDESVEIAKLSLWLRTAQKGRKLTSLNSNIKCGNSLIDSKAVAGDKAFSWEKEFPEVFAKGGFDVIIGNPPYVSSKDENFTQAIKEHLTKNYKTAVYQIDLYILFMERMLEINGKQGLISIIIPNAWLNNLFLKNVREFLLTNAHLKEIVSMPSNTFADANVDTVIVTYSDLLEDTETKLRVCINQEFNDIGSENQLEWKNNDGYTINVSASKEIRSILSKFQKDVVSLSSFTEIGRGVGVYHKRVGHTKEFIAKDPYQSITKDDETFVPYLRGKNVNRWNITWNNDSFISYGNWLAEPREPKFFEGKRLILRQIPSKRLIATYIEDQFIIDQSVFIARFIEIEKFKPLEVLAILNSGAMSFYFRYKYSEFDDLFPKVKLQHFKDFPISSKIIGGSNLENLAKQRLKLEKLSFDIEKRYCTYLKQHLNLEILSRKLEQWTLCDFNEFIKELNNTIKKNGGEKLSKLDEMEWMELFETKKKEALELKAEIDRTDREIDEMVYELYGLTDKEIQIVENS